MQLPNAVTKRLVKLDRVCAMLRHIAMPKPQVLRRDLSLFFIVAMATS